MTYITPEWLKQQFDAGIGVRSDLAEAMGVRRDIISKILGGSRAIHRDEIPLIEEYFARVTSGDAPARATARRGAAKRTEHKAVKEDPAVEPTTDLDDVLRRLDPEKSATRYSSWRTLMAQLSKLTDAELDYLSVAAEALCARRNQAKD